MSSSDVFQKVVICTSGIVVIGTGAVQAWKYLRPKLARVAAGQPHDLDLGEVELALAQHPTLQDAATSTQRSLEEANLPQAAQRVRAVQARARTRASTPRHPQDQAVQSQPPTSTNQPRNPILAGAQPSKLSTQSSDIAVKPLHPLPPHNKPGQPSLARPQPIMQTPSNRSRPAQVVRAPFAGQSDVRAAQSSSHQPTEEAGRNRRGLPLQRRMSR